MLRIAFIFLIVLGHPAVAADIRIWHSLSGANGAEFGRLVARFNASQAQFRVVAIYKGAYDEAAVEAVTARRTARAPHVVQASDLGGTFLLEQKDLVRPLWQIIDLRPELALAGGEHLLDEEGRLHALPLGRATTVLYFNRDAFRIAMLDPAKPPATWYDMVPTLAALVGSGSECALTMASALGAAREHGGVAQPGLRHRPAHVQQPPGGALGVDARHLAEVRLLHLFRPSRRSRGALPRRRLRAADRVFGELRGASQPREIRPR